jgi:hypothetical protein
MSEVEEVLAKIKALRKDLLDIEKGRGLQDPEVIKASQELNKAINKYYQLLKQKSTDKT